MKRFFALLLSLALCLSLSACAAQESERVVVASFYPVYIFAENLLDGVPGVRLTSLTPPTTGCLHDYQLLTSDMRALADASDRCWRAAARVRAPSSAVRTNRRRSVRSNCKRRSLGKPA